jgi:prepilin-type N-terminal cleavage/methylation domain-containing protein
VTRPSHQHVRAAARCIARAQARAFTFVEVTIVVFIIGIVASIALPRYERSLARHRAEGAARRLQLDLELARRLATVESRRYRVRLITGTSRYVLEKSLDGGTTWVSTPDPDRAGRGYYEVDLGKEPYVAKLTPIPANAGFTVVFDGWGKPAQNAALRVVTGIENRKLDVDATNGAITISNGPVAVQGGGGGLGS